MAKRPIEYFILRPGSAYTTQQSYIAYLEELTRVRSEATLNEDEATDQGDAHE